MNLNHISLASPILFCLLTGCSGREGDPGYFFHLVLIVIPIFIIGHYIHKKVEASSESLYVIEGQLKRLSSKVDSLEEKIDKKTSRKK